MSSKDRDSPGRLKLLLTRPRLAALGLLAVAVIALWQTSRLSRWSFDGPGPGLFPMIVAGVCAFLAFLVFVFPGSDDSTDSGDLDNTAGSNRPFVLYALVMFVLALGASYAGFALTCLTVAILIVRFAEGRSWQAALIYGFISAFVGLVGFGWLLRVDLPMSVIDRAVLSLLR